MGEQAPAKAGGYKKKRGAVKRRTQGMSLGLNEFDSPGQIRIFRRDVHESFEGGPKQELQKPANNS
jgi:hypothetical protein